MGAREMVDGFPLHKLRVRIPPSQTALVRTELLFSFVGCVYKPHSALGAFFFIRDIRMPSAIVFDCVGGKTEQRGNSSITQSLSLKSDYFVFFLHFLTSLYVFFTPQLEIWRAK